MIGSYTQLAITCSKLTIETLEKGVKASKLTYHPAGIYLLKVNNRNTRKRCEICSKLTIKTPERWRSSGVFIVVNGVV